MILGVNKEVKKQAKSIRKETEKLCKRLKDGDESGNYDTNDVLIRIDRIESELKELRDKINHEKERAYIERMGGVVTRPKQ